MTAQGSILIADDEDTFLEATKELLEEEGYDCHGVHDAHELSHALAKSEFDLLLTDLNMPGDHVMEKVQELRVQTRAMPVIVITGYPSLPTAIKSVHLNVLEYMVKPVNFPELLEAVTRGIHYRKVLTSLSQFRRESEQRTQNLAHLEETLSTFLLALNTDSNNPSPTDPPLRELDMHKVNPRPTISTDSHPPMGDYFRLRESIFHTIQILQKTKSAFRSKDLAGLRKHLEHVLHTTADTLKNLGPSAEKPPRE